METKRKPKVRVNIMIRPEILKKVDQAAGPYERSSYMSNACEEKLDRDKEKPRRG